MSGPSIWRVGVTVNPQWVNRAVETSIIPQRVDERSSAGHCGVGKLGFQLDLNGKTRPAYLMGVALRLVPRDAIPQPPPIGVVRQPQPAIDSSTNTTRHVRMYYVLLPWPFFAYSLRSGGS